MVTWRRKSRKPRKTLGTSRRCRSNRGLLLWTGKGRRRARWEDCGARAAGSRCGKECGIRRDPSRRDRRAEGPGRIGHHRLQVAVRERDGRDAGEIMVPKIEVTGLGDYICNFGYKTGSITYESEDKMFNYNRGIKLLAAKKSLCAIE